MSEDPGNGAMVKRLAGQLFDEWKIEQEREARESRKWYQSNAASWLGAVVVIGGLIITAGQIHSTAIAADERSIRNETAIETLRADNGDRLARIETKIDLMMEERKR